MSDSRTDVAAARRRNRGVYRKRLTGPEANKPAGTVPSALVVTVMIAPVVVVLGMVCIVRPRTAAGLGADAVLALGILLLLSPCFLVPRLRERRALRAAARTAAAALPAGSAPYAVTFGLTEDVAHDTDTEPTTWDRGPARSGATALTGPASAVG
ncbi:hypothetical protein ABT381_20310 [Streptomyces sp. NPDC000151]|uniref:hypothetical protein n=1 Tax=Streptomyces sp. NPDC000151 TaxID=3154244 RepID=UPI00332B16A1